MLTINNDQFAPVDQFNTAEQLKAEYTIADMQAIAESLGVNLTGARLKDDYAEALMPLTKSTAYSKAVSRAFCREHGFKEATHLSSNERRQLGRSHITREGFMRAYNLEEQH